MHARHKVWKQLANHPQRRLAPQPWAYQPNHASERSRFPDAKPPRDPIPKRVPGLALQILRALFRPQLLPAPKKRTPRSEKLRKKIKMEPPAKKKAWPTFYAIGGYFIKHASYSCPAEPYPDHQAAVQDL